MRINMNIMSNIIVIYIAKIAIKKKTNFRKKIEIFPVFFQQFEKKVFFKLYI